MEHRSSLVKKSVLLLGMTASLLSVMPALAEDAAGHWVGQLAGGFKVTVDIRKSADGHYAGTLQSPNGTVNPLDEVQASEDYLHFAAAKLEVSFDGVWDDGLKAWVGHLVKGQKYALNLMRAEATDQPAAASCRPQEEAIAAGPLPYDYQDVSFDSTAPK
jgi:hypothetical protein